MRESVYREIINNYVSLYALNTSMIYDMKQDIALPDEKQYVDRRFQLYIIRLKGLRDDVYTSFKSDRLFLEQLRGRELDRIEKIYDEIFRTLRNEEIVDQRYAASSDSKESPRTLISLEQEFINWQIEMLENLIRAGLDENLLMKVCKIEDVPLVKQLFQSESKT